MMQILLVDDDIQAIDGIAQNIDWEKLGIGNYFLALSAAQAKQIIQEHNISILITDIEMPEENGLELIEWVNTHAKNMASILLTSYGDFNYASRALRLHSSDYLLKPASYQEIEAAVKNAVKQIKKAEQQEMESRYANYWTDNLPHLRERFWYDILRGTVQQDCENISSVARKRHISYWETFVRPILFELPSTTDLNWEQSLIEVAMQNILGEVFENQEAPPVVLHLSGESYMALIFEHQPESALRQSCRDVVNVLESLLNGTVMCLLGPETQPQRLHQTVEELTQSRFPDVRNTGCVVHGDRAGQFRKAMDTWLTGLSDGAYGQVSREIHQYLTNGHMPQSQLMQLYRSLTWKIYQIISNKHMDAQQFYADQEIINISVMAGRTEEGLLSWLEYMLQRLTEKDPETKDATVAQIQNFIRAHLSEDLNRETIAASTYLSVDYISHLFTQKTGQCLSDYITAQRMEAAKNLLESTDTSVSHISTLVGYNNLSYFSRLFKRETGITPQKYRKNAKKSK